MGGRNAPQYFHKSKENGPKLGHAARGMITAFSVTISSLVSVAGQMVKRPLHEPPA